MPPRPTRSALAELAGLALALLASAWFIAAVTHAQAQDGQPVLREQIKVYSDLVTLGDLFENAGAAAETPVFRAPDIGTHGVVSSKRVAGAALEHGIIWDNPGGVEKITVERPSRLVELDEITRAIRKRVARELGLDDRSSLTITLSRNARPFHANPRVSGPLEVKRFDYQERTGVFRAVLGLESDTQFADRTYTGTAIETVAVPVPVRPIERGATIQEADLETVQMARLQLQPGIETDISAVAGMAARRPLGAGQPMRGSDLEPPKLVKRNTAVTVIYKIPGLILRAQGRALADAAHGETVSIQNVQSKRTIQARVSGPNQATVEPALRIVTKRVAQQRAPARPGPNVVR